MLGSSQDTYGYNPVSYRCDILCEEEAHFNTGLIRFFTIETLVPLTLMLVGGCRMYWAIRKERQNLQETEGYG